LSFSDARIRYFEQENRGVSEARNVGLENMRGDFFCFLDADDIYPKRSLESRYHLLKKFPFISFVDGQVQKYDKDMQVLLDTWSPKLKGDLLRDLVKLTGNSFFSPTWMIRKQKNRKYQFQNGLTHGEDLLFFMELARGKGSYVATDQAILNYRDSPNSAMKNLIGLENGYRFIESQIKNWPEIRKHDMMTFKWRYRKSMFLSYCRKGMFKEATRIWI
jgi:glycosyltransferase involved in cell wall biosynthesis